MFDNLPFLILILLFIGSGIIVWLAGIQLSKTTDILASRWGLGEALGGLIMLAIVTNLPEIAITISGALQGSLSLVTGNILGGIAIQTVVLVFLDIFSKNSKPLSYQSASLSLVLEALLVIGILSICIMGTQLPASLTLFHFAPTSLIIIVIWVIGLWLVGKSRKGLPWQGKGIPSNGQQAPRGHSHQKKNQKAQQKNISTTRTFVVFITASIVTLFCGFLLERTGTGIAKHIGMSGILFGSIVLASATALPELSTGIASIKLNDYQLAMSDIFGGNAFLPVLFFIASLLSGHAVLPHAQNTDIYLAALGMLLTSVYAIGLIFRPKQKTLKMGSDSLIVLLLYLLGIFGLIIISKS